MILADVIKESSCAEQATFWPRSANFRNAPFAIFRLFFFFQFLKSDKNHAVIFRVVSKKMKYEFDVSTGICNLVLKRVTAMSKLSCCERKILQARRW